MTLQPPFCPDLSDVFLEHVLPRLCTQVRPRPLPLVAHNFGGAENHANLLLPSNSQLCEVAQAPFYLEVGVSSGCVSGDDCS